METEFPCISYFPYLTARFFTLNTARSEYYSITLRFLESAAIGSDRIEKTGAVPPEC